MQRPSQNNQNWMLTIRQQLLRASHQLYHPARSLRVSPKKKRAKKGMINLQHLKQTYRQKRTILMMRMMIHPAQVKIKNKIEVWHNRLTQTMMKKSLSQNLEMYLLTRMGKRKLLNVTSAKAFQMKSTKMKIQTATKRKKYI